MPTLATDLKFAARLAMKTPWMTAASVIALGAAMAVTIASFSLVWDAYFVALPFEEAERIVAARDLTQPDPDDVPPRLAVVRIWGERAQSLDLLAATYTRWRDVADGEGGLARYPVATMTAAGFDVTGVAPLLGRTLNVADEEPGAPPVVVLGHRVWRSLLGADRAVVGSMLKVDGVEREIVGVMPEGFRFPVSEDLWVPFNTDPAVYGGIEPRWINVFGRLADGATLESAEAELEALRAGYVAENPGDTAARDRRTTVIPYIQSQNEGGTEVLFIGMFVFIVLVLVVACGSVANLLLARATSRTGEIAVRAALGASRRRLITQMFLEALMLSMAGALFGIVAAYLGLQWFESFLQVERTPFWLQFGMSPAAIAFAVVASFAAAAIAGITPALKATGMALHEVLKDEQGTSSAVRFGAVSGALTVVEITLSVAFLGAAALAAQSLLVTGNLDRDLPTEQVLVASIALVDEVSTDSAGALIVPEGAIAPDQWGLFRDQIRDAALQLPGVRDAVLASTLPGQQHGRSRVELESESAGNPAAGVSVPVAEVSPEFFAAFDSPLLAGRNFTAADTAEAERVAVVNNSFARRFFGERNPIGRRFRPAPGDDESPWIRIVGIAPDLRMNPGSESQAGYYLPVAQYARRTFYLALRVDGAPLSLAGAVDDAIARIDGRIDAAEFQTHAELADNFAVAYKIMSLLFASLGGTAVFLSVAGLYAVMAFSVAQRTREIGVRLALGAARGRILAVVLRRGLLQIGVGIVLGSALGLGLVRLLQFIPTGMASDGTVLLAAAAAVMLAAGLAACIVPASRALAIHPVEALRRE